MSDKDVKKTEAKPDDGPIVGVRPVVVEKAEPRTALPDDGKKLTKARARALVQEGGRGAIPNDPMASAADRQPQPVGGTDLSAVNADGEPDDEDKAAERLAFHGVKRKSA